jgi:hypothetical protein
LGGLALFVALNVVAALANAVLSPRADPGPLGRYGIEKLRKAYANRSDASIRELLEETWNPRQLEYHPFAQSRSVARSGRHVNVSVPGYRHVSGQRPWPPPAGVAAILFFGGSTAFGLGVSDEETIASRLQDRLAPLVAPIEVAVYNFGTPAHFSLQEAALLQSLLVAGVKPRMAVLDGLNDFAYPGDPEGTTLLRGVSSGRIRCPLLETLPLLKLAREIRHRSRGLPARPNDDAATAEAVIRRWILNARGVRSLASEFGFEALWVWQPVPTYGYDLGAHALFDGTPEFFGIHRLSTKGYPLARALHDAGSLGEDVLWLGDLQRGRAENLYVDQCHYTAAFSAEIAQHIAEALAERLVRNGTDLAADEGNLAVGRRPREWLAVGGLDADDKPGLVTAARGETRAAGALHSSAWRLNRTLADVRASHCAKPAAER